MGLAAPLHELADDGDARGSQQLLQLGELLRATVGQGGDQIGTLAGAPASWLRGVAGALRTAVAALRHDMDGSRDAARLTDRHRKYGRPLRVRGEISAGQARNNFVVGL